MLSWLGFYSTSASSMVVGLGLSSVLFMFTALALSTLFIYAKKKPEVVREKEEKEVLHSYQESSASAPKPNIAVKEEECQEHSLNYSLDYSTSSADFLSESEGHDPLSTTSTEDSEMEWSLRDQSRDCSDGSISDEDSLIEITLPTGNPIRQHKEEEPKLHTLQRKPEFFFPESIFRQQHLMELLAEFNEMNIEEENLIEIDISIGSIKYSRFEIEA